MTDMEVHWRQIKERIAAAAKGRTIDLVAVSKLQSAEAIRALAACGQRAFGENYLQEAMLKRTNLADLDLEWHLIGPLQSNKCRDAARHFDWVQSIDRARLVPLLAEARGTDKAPLNVLIQVNISGEASKSGCAPDAIEGLAALIEAHHTLRLRGLMAIPSPAPDVEKRTSEFAAMQALFDPLRMGHPHVDTLSMGMSDDYPLAIEQGATMVRIGSALFGARALSTP